jgi:hypothetical protein
LGIAQDVYLQRSDQNFAGIWLDDVRVALQDRKHVLDRFTLDQHQAATLSERTFEQQPALSFERHEKLISRVSILRSQFRELSNVVY